MLWIEERTGETYMKRKISSLQSRFEDINKREEPYGLTLGFQKDNRENVGKQRAEMTAAASMSELMTEAHLHFKGFDLDHG